VAFMRRGVVNLAAAREKEARAGLLEFTALKVSVSCLTALGLAMLAESGCALDFQISMLLNKLHLVLLLYLLTFDGSIPLSAGQS